MGSYLKTWAAAPEAKHEPAGGISASLSTQRVSKHPLWRAVGSTRIPGFDEYGRSVQIGFAQINVAPQNCKRVDEYQSTPPSLSFLWNPQKAGPSLDTVLP
jgi:hypothetical protein